MRTIRSRLAIIMTILVLAPIFLTNSINYPMVRSRCTSLVDENNRILAAAPSMNVS